MEDQVTIQLTADDVRKEYAAKLSKEKDPVKISEMLKELTTALAKVAPKGRVDRIAFIDSLTNITDVRKAKQTAQAKEAKAKDNPETKKRYHEEFLFATEKLNKLIGEVGRYNPVALLAAGEDASRVVQVFLGIKEQQFEVALAEFHIKKGQKKKLANLQLDHTMPLEYQIPGNLAEELKAIHEDCLEKFVTRLKDGDKRVESIVRVQLLINGLNDGSISLVPNAPIETSRQAAIMDPEILDDLSVHGIEPQDLPIGSDEELEELADLDAEQ